MDDQTVDEYNSFEQGCVDNTDSSTTTLVNDLTDSDKTLIITTIQSYMIKETIADGNVLRFSVEYIRSISVNSIPIQRALPLTRFKYNHYSCLPFF